MRLDPRFADIDAPDLLSERVILVTGAGDGIGRAIALGCAARGATVILLGRTTEKLEKVYDEIQAAGGPEPAIFPMDLAGAIAAQYDMLAQRVEEQFGRLDGLVHNAAVLGMMTPIEHYPPEIWQELIQVNVNAPFLMTHALLPLLQRSAKEHEYASVIFTSSGVGRRGRAFWGGYSTSKFAIEGLTQVLADEVDTVRVNVINPGATRTRMRANAFPAEDPETLLTPEEIAKAWIWLLANPGPHGESLDAQIP